jgi:DNA modification methylase
MKRDQEGNEDTARSIEIVYRPIGELELDAKNPRLHSPRQVRQIAHSIKTFGMNVPVLINRAGRVIAGHGRIMACQQLGRTEVPTIALEHLSETQIRAFMIADNRLTENSEWDERLLAEQLTELSELDLDFTLDVTGFEIGEIDLRVEQLTSASDGAETRANSLPDPRTGPPVTRPGDIWLLNDHRVFCGSALEEDSYAALMEGQEAQMVFTDPPYNLRIDGNVTGSGTTHHREFAMASGEMSERQFTRFLADACSLLAKHSAAGSLHYLCMDWRHLNELLAAGREVYSEVVNLCVWVKNNGGLGSLYRSQHELIFVFKSGGGSHRNNVMLGQYGRNRTNVWNYECASSFSRSGDEGNLFALHPTVKPAALVADAIMDCTTRRDVVLDGFLGSGTSVIAAERTGRRCFGLEIDPIYVDVIVRRWQAYTRQTAHHAHTGRSFVETEAEVKECDSSMTTAAPKTTIRTR